MSELVQHLHGKSRVRVARVWREANDVHHFVEWNIECLLGSHMEHAFLTGSNADMTPTDTVKNTCYILAKQLKKRTSAEMFAAIITEHFIKTYPKVFAVDVTIEQKAWTRTSVNGEAHHHGFTETAPATRLAYALGRRGQRTEVSGGLTDMRVLKTTQSGYVGFGKCTATTLPESTDRILATSVTAMWRYKSAPRSLAESDGAYDAIVKAFHDTFFGPAKTGVYSPGVQTTLYDMAKAALAAAGTEHVEQITLTAPNLHFIPSLPAGLKNENDVYVATSEPHGTIQCTVSRNKAYKPRPKL